MHLNQRIKKTLLTALLMMAYVSLCQYVFHLPVRSSSCIFGMLFVYMAGIFWVLKGANIPAGQMKLFFQHGFRSFMLITFLMVLFFMVFYKLNPQILNQFILENNASIRAIGGKTPSEIEANEKMIRSYFIPMTISFYTLLLLFIGVVTSVACSVFLSRSK